MSPSGPPLRDHRTRIRHSPSTSFSLRKSVAIPPRPLRSSPYKQKSNDTALPSPSPFVKRSQNGTSRNQAPAALSKVAQDGHDLQKNAPLQNSLPIAVLPPDILTDAQPEAGPSKLPSSGSTPTIDQSRKGKERMNPPKPLEKRVMPGRIRRAAGGGAEGIRDLEEMVVDWLDRWGMHSLFSLFSMLDRSSL